MEDRALERSEHIRKAIAREDSIVQRLQQQGGDLNKKCSSKGIAGEEKNRRLMPVIECKLRHQRLREQIASEFDLPAKYPLERVKLQTKKEKV